MSQTPTHAQPSLYINAQFNPHDGNSDSSEPNPFANESEDEESYGLQRAIPSNKLNWDSVRSYSSALTARPDILSGLVKPPPATFYDMESESAANRRNPLRAAHTPQNGSGKPVFSRVASGGNKNGGFGYRNNGLNPSNTEVMVSDGITTPKNQFPDGGIAGKPVDGMGVKQNGGGGGGARRNTLKASTMQFCKEQIENNPNNAGPLALLRQNSQPPQKEKGEFDKNYEKNNGFNGDDSDIPPPPPPPLLSEVNNTNKNKNNNNDDDDDDDHEFVKKMLAKRRQSMATLDVLPNLISTRRSSINYEVDLGAASLLPPPPDEMSVNVQKNDKNNDKSVKNIQIRSNPINPTAQHNNYINTDSPPPGVTKLTQQPLQNNPQTPRSPQTSSHQPLPPTPSKKNIISPHETPPIGLERRKRNLSRAEQDLIDLLVKRESTPPLQSRTIQQIAPPSPQPSMSQEQKSIQQALDVMGGNFEQNNYENLNSDPKSAQLPRDVIFEGDEYDLLSPIPPSASYITQKPALPTANPYYLWELHRQTQGIKKFEKNNNLKNDLKNDPSTGNYSIPSLESLVKLGVILTFGQYSIDTYIDDAPTEWENSIDLYSGDINNINILSDSPNLNQNSHNPKKISLKLQPYTYQITSFLDHGFIYRSFSTRSQWIEYRPLMDLRINFIPFEIPLDLHPRSFGVSLLLTAALVLTSQTISTDLNTKYQQTAVFFLSLAIILQIGLYYTPSSLIPYETSKNSLIRSINNKNQTVELDTPPQEDLLFYLSLLNDSTDYQNLYTLYTMHDPITMSNTLSNRGNNDQDKGVIGKKTVRPVDYSHLVQIEHHAGLRFYQLASIVEDAYTSYYAYINTIPSHGHNSVIKPQFVTQTDCFILGYLLWLKSAMQSYPPSIADTSWARYSGYGLEQEFDLAFHWVYIAATLGDARAMNNLGLYYKKGIGSNQIDIGRCYYWLQKAKMAGYSSLSVKTLHIVEKQLGLVGVEPRNNPYLHPSYGQLIDNTTIVPLDTWDNWIVGSETYKSDKFDVFNQSGLFTQKKRVDLQYEITMDRLRSYPPLIQISYNNNPIIYNAALIHAMIPRLVVNQTQAPRRGSIGSRRSSVSNSSGNNYGHNTPGINNNIGYSNVPNITIAVNQPETATFPPLPLPPTTPLPPLPPLPPVPVMNHTLNNVVSPQRPSVFQRGQGMSTLTRPQTYTLSRQDIDQLKQQQQELQHDHLGAFQGNGIHTGGYGNDPFSKMPIKPNYGRILASNISNQSGTKITQDDNNTYSITINNDAALTPLNIPGNGPNHGFGGGSSQGLMPLPRLDSVSSIDPLFVQKQHEIHTQEASQSRYLQQDAVPPPPPPPSDDEDNGGQFVYLNTPSHFTKSNQNNNFEQKNAPTIPAKPTQQFPRLLPITPNEADKQPSNSHGVSTFNPNTNTYINTQHSTFSSSQIQNSQNSQNSHRVAPPTPSRPAPPRPSVVPTPTPLPITTPTPITTLKTPQQQQQQPQQQPQQHRPTTTGSSGATGSLPAMSTHSTTTRRSIGGNDRASQGTIILVNATPMLRTPEMTQDDWVKVTRTHYRHTLAKMMNLTTNGFITRLDHLNQLAELRVSYGLTPDHHQTEYHYCKQLYDRRERDNNDKYAMVINRKKTLSNMQKTMRLEQYEREFEEHKKKLALGVLNGGNNGIDGNNNDGTSAVMAMPVVKHYGTCLICKVDGSNATQRIQPCGHYSVCYNCSIAQKIKKCPYCGGLVKSIDTDPPNTTTTK